MCDFFLSPLFKGVGGSKNYATHKEIPPSPPFSRKEQEKVAPKRGVLLKLRNQGNKLVNLLEIDLYTKVEFDKICAGEIPD
ncbi:MAG: hypothetical protein N4J56_002467 [Chroococcidiopsis sp. SAG 2025]|nr:hypothetical protein [Chroococcidiopsis sp. SAG 2025]